MKRSVILLITLVLLLGVWWFMSQKEESQIEALSAERSFHINDIEDVDRVLLEYVEQPDVNIVKENGRWYANDSVEVWSPTMLTILSTLRDARVEYTPPNSAKDKINQDIAKFGIKVTAFDGGEALTSFSLGGVTPGEDGTYAIKEGHDQPFVLAIPYQQGTLRSRFVYNAEEWKNRWVFREPLKKIKKVTVEYPPFPDRSFVMERLGSDDYEISRISGESGGTQTQKVPVGTAEGYLSTFQEVGIEAYENDYKKRDSITNLAPLVTITVDSEEGQKWIKLYPINHETGEVDLSQEFLNKGQLFRFFGDYSSGDFVIIQFFTIGDALRKYTDFVD